MVIRLSEPALKIFIGYDTKEPAAFGVAVQSLLAHASRPVTIVPLVQQQLRHQGLYTRERKPNESTEFSLTRFLVPYLSNYQGISLFVDCDVLFRCDVGELLLYPLADPGKAVYVAQHDYQPKDIVKFDGHEQTTYPCKNWSSVALFVNSQCKALTLDYVNTATALDLHRFHWTTPEHIGALPLEFNWLVGEYATNSEAKILHYTLGVPAYPEYGQCDHAADWWETLRTLLKPATAIEAAMHLPDPRSPGLKGGKGKHRCEQCGQDDWSDAELFYSGRCRACRGVTMPTQEAQV